MGVTCTATVFGQHAPTIASSCLDAVADLEALWSRFVPTSDICRMNEAQGRPIYVDPRTVGLLHHMVAATNATNGFFNPTLLPVQIECGDDHSLVDDKVSHVPPTARPFTSLDDIEIFDDGRVRLPAGMTLDAGGIGKGLAADLVTARALDMGAESACLNVGGDLRVSGPTPDGHGWTVDVLDPTDLSTIISSIIVAHGGVATSSLSARRRGGRGIDRHIIDSRHTNNPARVIGATVAASTAAWAEAWTKHAVVAPVGATLESLERLGLAGLIVTADGETIETSTWKDFQP